MVRVGRHTNRPVGNAPEFRGEDPLGLRGQRQKLLGDDRISPVEGAKVVIEWRLTHQLIVAHQNRERDDRHCLAGEGRRSEWDDRLRLLFLGSRLFRLVSTATGQADGKQQ